LAAQGRRAVPLIQGGLDEVSNPSEPTPAPVVPSPDPWSAMWWARIPPAKFAAIRRQSVTVVRRRRAQWVRSSRTRSTLSRLATRTKLDVFRVRLSVQFQFSGQSSQLAEDEPNGQVPCSALELSSRWLVAANALYSLDGSKLLGYAASGALCSFDGTARSKGSTAATRSSKVQRMSLVAF